VREENLRHSQLVTARYPYPTLTDVRHKLIRPYRYHIRFVALELDSVGPVGLDLGKPFKKKKKVEISNHLIKVGDEK
jgi:hypothetical protein